MTPDNLLKVGIIGTGMVSQIAHLPAIAALKNIRLESIADHDLNRANEVARRFKCNAVFSSDQELFKKAVLDAVVVVVPRHKTAAIVKAALTRGLHVLSEKPMAMNLAEAEELVRLAESKKLIYAVGFMKRYDWGVNKARQLLSEAAASGRLGKLIMVRGKNFCAEYVGDCEDYIRGTPKAGHVPEPVKNHREWFANVGLHSVNLLRYLLNCELQCRHADIQHSHSMSALLDAAGVAVSFDMGKSATGKWEESFEFFFERGRLKLQLTSLKQKNQSAVVTLDENVNGAKTQYFVDHSQPWSFNNQMQAFISAVSDGEAGVLATGKDSLNDMVLMNEIYSKV